MRRAAFVCLLLAAVLAAVQAQTAGPSRMVRVAAASDLKFALDEVKARLAARPAPVAVETVYGSSGTLHAQLRQRAPYDVFLSADAAYPRDLVSRGIGAERDLFTYAFGHLVVWVPDGSRMPIERDGLRALEQAQRISLANPRHAPYGRAAEMALRQARLWERLGPRLVLGENAAQAAQFVQSGAADAGIIARSLAVAPAMRDSGRSWDVPQDAHPPLQQDGLILPWAASRDAALQLREYLLSDEGRALLASRGFGVPPR